MAHQYNTMNVLYFSFLCVLFTSVIDETSSDRNDPKFRLSKVNGPVSQYTFSGVGLTQVYYPCFQCVGEPCMPQLIHCLADVVVRELEEQQELLKYLEVIAATLKEVHSAQRELITLAEKSTKGGRVKRRHAHSKI